ncbi:hypothetical protein CEY12_14160 [Chryseobacterium sp. T16E-39]|uniref:hypothetical protein n=1 Tax=Chryseobacterium sp. T16E-39 TaxID=2015076 RepID=UPI000B5B440A|nr:hypothetical protein [Chryseobacterium sp. T16E-39]ASK31181.1 hypothetical protein CEY12_14160 [Chryseobacterium sp. T16E-39]
METRLQHTNNLRYDEVYISDLRLLKQIFMQKKDSKIVNEDFGLPFLLAKKKDLIIAFACLVICPDNKIDFMIYGSKDLNAEEQEDFRAYVEEHCKKNSSANYYDPEQLKSTISRLINWING